jgi:hypothetical protein
MVSKKSSVDFHPLLALALSESGWSRVEEEVFDEEKSNLVVSKDERKRALRLSHCVLNQWEVIGVVCSDSPHQTP